jgi:hypothetical protein
MKWLRLLVTAGAFLTLGVWVAPSEPRVGGLLIASSGLAIVLCLIILLTNGADLALTQEGLTFKRFFRTRFVAWSNVQSFRPVRVGLVRSVGWTYVPGFRGFEIERRLSAALTELEDGLPDTYGASAEDLARMLNELRDKFGEPAPNNALERERGP